MSPRALAALLLPAAAAHAQCPDGWLPAHPDFGVLGFVAALALYDADGPGPAPELLIVAGQIGIAGSLPVGNIAAWNGSAWSPLGDGLDGPVHALAVRGGTLFVAGRFSAAGGAPATNVAAWDGSAWQPLSLAAPDGIASLAVFGGDLYATRVQPTYYHQAPLYRRDAVSWVTMPTPCGSASRIATYGDRMLLGGNGQFDHCACLQALSTSGWTDIIPAGPCEYPEPMVWSLATAGPCIAVHGHVGGNAAVWTGSAWAFPGLNWGNSVQAVANFRGEAIIGGHITDLPGVHSPGIIRYDGSAWRPVGSGVLGAAATVGALLIRGDQLIVGGSFSSAGGRPAASLALWGPAPACYANCDCSSEPPILTINDFTCFLNKFAAADPAANCDSSTTAPYLNISDFICFLNRYAKGCP